MRGKDGADESAGEIEITSMVMGIEQKEHVFKHPIDRREVPPGKQNVTSIMQYLEQLGYGKANLKSDGEPAINAVARAVAIQGQQTAVFFQSPSHDPANN